MNTATPGRLLQRFLRCQTPRETYDFLKVNPAILTGESVVALRGMQDAAAQGGHDDAARLIDRYRGRLERCVALGLDPAFCAAGLSWLCLPDQALRAIADAVVDRLAAFQETGNVSDLDQAIEADAPIARHPGFRRVPGALRAAVDFDAGVLFRMRYDARHDPGDLGHATARWQQALDAIGVPGAPGPAAAGFARYLSRYLVAQADWVSHTGNLAPLDESIRRAEDAVRRVPLADVPDGPRVWLGLSRVSRERAQRTGDLADIERGVSAAETGLRLWPPDDEDGQASARQILGNALQDRYAKTGRLADLNDAYEAFSAAVSSTPEDAEPAELAPRLTSLANALRDRFARTGDAGDLNAAIEARRKVLAITPASDPQHWQWNHNLGTNLRERYLLTQHAADIEESVASYETALTEVAQYSSDMRWIVVTGLAAALRTRFVFRHQRSDLERAITLYEAQLAELGPGLPARDGCRVNLANALWDRSRTFGTKDDARRAMDLYLAVLASPLATPEFAIRTAGNLIDVATELQAWPEVAQASLAGLAAIDRLVQIQLTREQKETWLRNAKKLSSSAAFALTQMGRQEEALVALETGRARLLSETFNTERTVADPVLAAHSAAEIAEAVTGAPLVYVTAAEAGGLALIVSGPPRAIRSVWLPQLTDEELRDRILRYLETLGNGSLGTELVVLDDLGRWLWEAVADPILAELGRPPEIVLIPAGMLTLLPLHAAWRPDDRAPAGRVYLVDECAVTYAANARARRTAVDRASRTKTASFLVVEDPRPTSATPLDHAGPEADAVLAGVPGQRLRHEEATKARVRAALREHSVLHFACHGSASPAAPLQSRLILAHDEPLTLGELMTDRLGQARLAVLSACETAMVGSELMDEVVNFPTGMLQAGVAACIGSLWEVPDTSTALLMRRFYELWRGGGIGPGEALRGAQRWLRDVSNEELIATGYAPAQQASSRPALVQDFWLKACPYYHPFYWAAFTFYGA